MKTYQELNVHEKLHIKQRAMNIYGKRWHSDKPNHLSVLNELQIWTIIHTYAWHYNKKNN